MESKQTLVAKLAKNSEFTYGVHARSLAYLVTDNQATPMATELAHEALKKMDGMVMGSVRALNNQFELLRQGIAYTLVFKIDDNGELLFLVYKRTKLNGEGRLAEKLSLAPGGHIEGRDLSYYLTYNAQGEEATSDTIDWNVTLLKNLRRELCEEVDFTSQAYQHTDRHVGLMAAASAKPIGFVMDSKPEIGYVGNVHFGAVYAANVPRDTTFEMKEECNSAVAWVSANDLIDHVHKGGSTPPGYVEFEPWSVMIIRQIHNFSKSIYHAFNRETPLGRDNG